MRLLVTLCVFTCLGMQSNEALPFSFRGSHSAGDTLLLMPGVQPHRVVKDLSDGNRQTTTTHPPVVFEHTFDDTVPISFGNPIQVLPSRENERGEFLPVIPSVVKESTSEEPRNEGPNNMLILGQGPSEAPTPLPATSNVTDEEGSGDDNVFFPSKIRVDITNRDAAAGESNPNVGKCGLESGSVDVNGTCVTFLGRSGCPANEWYVMSNESSGVGECVPRPCPLGQLFYRGRCVGAADPAVCSEGQMLYVDFDGYVHCDCMPNFIYDPWSGKCYAQGDQGNCNFGYYMYVDDESGFVECKKNPCFMDGFVYHNLTGQCYKKLYTGFCVDGLLIAYEGNRTAECQAIVVHSIFDLPTTRACAQGTARDFAGNCREAFRVPSASSYPQIYGGCPYGFSKDPRGTCRRIHSLFG